MASTQRIDKLERQRETLEEEYRTALIAALQDCAEGKWGLFAQNLGLLPASMEARFKPGSAKRVDELAADIAAIRQVLGYSEPFALIRQLETYRRQRGANALGEKRLAEQFLQQLGCPVPATLSPEGRGDDAALPEPTRSA